MLCCLLDLRFFLMLKRKNNFAFIKQIVKKGSKEEVGTSAISVKGHFKYR